jgi:hypothetical protein
MRGMGEMGETAEVAGWGKFCPMSLMLEYQVFSTT